jgi:hypothetical protein
MVQSLKRLKGLKEVVLSGDELSKVVLSASPHEDGISLQMKNGVCSKTTLVVLLQHD